MLRQQAEVEAAKRGAKRAEEKKNSGWFGGWFGGGKKKDEEKEKSEVENIREFVCLYVVVVFDEWFISCQSSVCTQTGLSNQIT